MVSIFFFNIPGNMNLFAIICAVLFIVALIIVLYAVLSLKRQSAKYYTHEDKLGLLHRSNVKYFPREFSLAHGMYFNLQMASMKKIWIHCQLMEMNSAINIQLTILSIQLMKIHYRIR